jgi:hypothetical protein
MPALSSNLRAQLSAAQTKTAWSNLLKSLLGSNIRIRCFRSSNASSTDPSADGVEFLNVGSNGDFKFLIGEITSLGVLSGFTTKAAADLATGKSILRIEGNGYSITFSLGLTGSGKEFMLGANPTTATSQGIAFSSSASLKPPLFLASGAGPAAPDVPSDAVVAMRLVDWRNPAAPVAVGTAPFSQREPNIVSERYYIAREMGDVRQMRVPDGGGIVFGTGGDCFKFAGTSYIMNAAANSEANVPLQQVEIRAMPHNRWASWPFKKDLNVAEDTLIPWPFKIELLKADGSIKDVIEMYSSRVNNVPGTGKAINSATQTLNPYQGPSEPFWACTQLLGWMSHKPKPNTSAQHLLPGVEADVFHPSQAAARVSSQMVYPPITGNQTYDGLSVWRVSPKWPRAVGTGLDTTIIDNSLSYNYQAADQLSQVIGRGWQPGADAQHTMYMAPGGQRPDRSYKGNTVLAWATLPTGTRVHGAVPYREIMDDFTKGFWGHGCHYFTDVERGMPISKPRVLNNQICYADVYYRGGSENYVPDIENSAVRLFSATNGNNIGVLDKYGRSFNNEYARDYMHNQSNSSHGAYLMNSPLHMIEARHFFTGSVLCTSWIMGNTFSPDDFLGRQFVWYWGQFTDMWLSATNDARGINSTEIENMWQKHAEMVHDVMMPIYTTGTDVYAKTLRGMGIGSYVYSPATGFSGAHTWSDSKSGYMGQVLALMKQSGAFAMLRGKSAKCAAIVDLIIECCHKLTVDFFVDSDGRFDQSADDLTWVNGSEPATINWAVYSPPKNGLDWIRREDGQIKAPGVSGNIDTTSTMHARAQMMFILDTFFPEYVYPRMAQAKTKVRQYYADVEANRLAGRDTFAYRYIMFGIYKAPTQIGAPT